MIGHEFNNEIFKTCKSASKFFESFVYNDDFTGKRFNRYVEKTKEYIFDKVSTIFPDMNEENETCKEMRNFNDFVTEFLYSYYFYPKETKEAYSTFSHIIHEYKLLPAQITNKEKLDYLETFFMMPNEVDDNDYTIYDFIEYETRIACREFIKERAMKMDHVDSSNYFLTLVDNTNDALMILTDVLNWVHIDLQEMLSKKVDNKGEASSNVDSKAVDILNEQIKDMTSVLDALKKELEVKDKKINELSDKLSKKEKEVKELAGEHIEYNNALERENSKLKGKYNDLLGKYNDLKQKAESKDNEEIIEAQEKEIKELDLNGNYLFIISNAATFKGKIQETFPNANFSNNSNINVNNVDMVVIITTHVDHSTYYRVKDICKTNNVPVIHCKFSNIELIKQLMWNELYL